MSKKKNVKSKMGKILDTDNAEGIYSHNSLCIYLDIRICIGKTVSV